MPQGRSMAKDLSFIPLSAQARPAVEFHWSKFQHLVWLWMWSKRQCSGTKRASDWKGPSEGRMLVACKWKYFVSVREISFWEDFVMKMIHV